VCYDVSVPLSESVKALRRHMGITQQELSVRLGISARAVANYEGRKREPSIRVLNKISKLAEENGAELIARAFADAGLAALGGTLKPIATNDEEKSIVLAALCLIREKEKVEGWDAICQSLINALEKLGATAETKFTRTDRETISAALKLAKIYLEPDVSKKIEVLARERMVETGESFEKARTEVLLDNPHLYNQLVKERSANKVGVTANLWRLRGD
jgi:transcriptional regulator with XRE-family HTH domain